MIVSPSGVIFRGQCEIQSAECTARESGALTAVWTAEPREQVSVCRACVEAMIRAGEWEVSGARVRQGVDIVLRAPDGQALLLVEVKRIPSVTYDEDRWAQRVHRNLVSHGAFETTAPFVLAAMPKRLYWWPTESSANPDASFASVVKLDRSTQRHLAQLMEQPGSNDALEHGVVQWLSASLWERDMPWLQDDILQQFSGTTNSLRWTFQ